MQDDIIRAYEAFKFIKESKVEGSNAGLLMLEALFNKQYSQVEGEFKITLLSGWLEVEFWHSGDSQGWELVSQIEEEVKVLFPLLKTLFSGYSHTIKVIVKPNGVIQIAEAIRKNRTNS